MNSFRRLAVVVVVLLSPMATSAALIERTVDLDLLQLSLPAGEINTTIDFDEISLGVGDQFAFTINFVGGNLRVIDTAGPDFENLQFIFAENSGQTGFLFDASLTLLNWSGNLLQDTVSSGFGGPIGGGFTANLTDTTFRYGGLRYVANINFKEPGRPDFVASSVRFDHRFLPQSPGVDAGTGLLVRVPEPGTLALLGIALLGMGAARRKKRA